MKPIKGMNLDVSPDSQPQGTYRAARNWVYDSEFDGLQQEPGRSALEAISTRHIVASHTLENGDILALCRLSATNGSEDEIKLYQADNNTWVTVLDDDSLNFDSARVYDIEVFRNTDNDRIAIITDGATRPLVINIDILDADQPAYDLLYLFPTRRYPIIEQSSQSTGTLDPGTYFFSVQYELEDGTTTDFGPATGPFRNIDEQGGFLLGLSELDTNYTKYRVAVFGVSNTSIVCGIAAEGPASSSTATVFVGGIIEEALLEEVAVLPTSYTSAQTIEWHENRLYMGNVTQHDEDASVFQGYANAIQPMWEVRKTVGDYVQNGTDNDPTLHRFMPDEVYAFYVAWVRDDGTYTQAYHIPGRPSKSHNQKIPSGASGLASTETRVIDETETIANILAATGSGEINEGNHLDFLKNDRNIFDSGDYGYHNAKFYQTRCTATTFTDTNSYHHGQMGYWENENEVYPANFPAQLKYAWAPDGGSASGQTVVSLAGEKVRHHRMPSIGYLMNVISGDFDFDPGQNHGIQVRFEFVRLPVGCKGAVIYHAKRTNQNNIVLSHTPIHFGALNTYELAADLASDRVDYSIQSVVNCRNANLPLHEPNSGSNLVGTQISYQLSNALEEAAGGNGRIRTYDNQYFTLNDYSNSNSANFDTYSTEYQDRLGVHYGKAVSHAHDLLGATPTLPRYMYTRLEYMLIQMEDVPDFVEGYTGGNNSGRGSTMSINSSTSNSYYATTTDETGINKCRRMMFNFRDTQTLGINQPFPQSEILPCREQRYIPAGVLDEEVKFDNRRSPECLYWEYKMLGNNETPYNSQTNYHNAGERMWYSILNNPDIYSSTATGDTDDARFVRTAGGATSTNVNRSGYYLQHTYTRNTVLAVARLPFVNVNAFRFDCYSGYDRQELVACTPVLTGAALQTPLLIGGAGPASRRVTSDYVHGDVRHSKRRYRVTANAGFSAGVNATHEQNLSYVSSTSTSTTSGSVASFSDYPMIDLIPDITRNNTTGTVTALYEVNTLGPVESGIHDRDKTQTTEKEYDSLLRPANAENTNDVSIDANLMRLNDWIQPVISDGVTDLNFTHSYRVARSRSQDNASDALNFRKFAALDFFEQPRNRGTIQNLQSFADKLLIHHEDGLFVTVGKESIQTTSGAVVLGSGDIFRVKPQELVPTEFGFAGTQNLQSCVLTPQGYFWVDMKRKKVFLYNGKVEEISNRGMRGWFEDKLELSPLWFHTHSNVNSYGLGVKATYDPVFNRVMLMIRNVDVTTLGIIPFAPPSHLTDYYTGTVNSDYKVLDEMISYSFNNNAWVSMHDMVYDQLTSSASTLYGILTDSIGTKLYKLNDYSVTPVTYISDPKLQTTVPAQIDIAFPANDPVQWQSFSWHTKAREHATGSSNYGHIDLNKTFVKAAVYNDYQCSGDVTFTKASDIDILTTQRVTLRHNGTRYQFNGFRDLVDDRTERFMDPDYVFDTTNLNASKDWFDQRRFKSTYAVLRLISPDSTSNLLYLYDVDAKVRKAYR